MSRLKKFIMKLIPISNKEDGSLNQNPNISGHPIKLDDFLALLNQMQQLLGWEQKKFCRNGESVLLSSEIEIDTFTNTYSLPEGTCAIYDCKIYVFENTSVSPQPGETVYVCLNDTPCGERTVYASGADYQVYCIRQAKLVSDSSISEGTPGYIKLDDVCYPNLQDCEWLDYTPDLECLVPQDVQNPNAAQPELSFSYMIDRRCNLMHICGKISTYQVLLLKADDNPAFIYLPPNVTALCGFNRVIVNRAAQQPEGVLLELALNAGANRLILRPVDPTFSWAGTNINIEFSASIRIA